MNVKPITVREVEERFGQELPNFVLETVNQLIIDHWNKCERGATIPLKELNEAIEEQCFNYDLDYYQLDLLQECYRNYGWIVKQDHLSCIFLANKDN